MLNQPPIFLGGQGGLVGPSRIGFGTVIAAGTVFRRDSLEGGKLLLGGVIRRKELPLYPGLFRNVKQKTVHNINYIANLIALRNWYSHLRPILISGAGLQRELLKFGIDILDRAVEERVHRLIGFAEKLPVSAEIYRKTMKGDDASDVIIRKEQLFESRHQVGDLLLAARQREYGAKSRDNFLAGVNRSRSGGEYTEEIQALPSVTTEQGIAWLQGIVDVLIGEVLEILPAFR